MVSETTADAGLWFVNFHPYTGHGVVVGLFNSEERAREVFDDAHKIRVDVTKDILMAAYEFTDDFGISHSLNLMNHVTTMNTPLSAAFANLTLRDANAAADAKFGRNGVGFAST